MLDHSPLFELQVESEKKKKTAMKLVCMGNEEQVVGLHCIGMGSDEMLQGFGVAIKVHPSGISRP
jgi:glutathione reductase (NADPH)